MADGKNKRGIETTLAKGIPVRVIVLRAPGTNCDLETVHAFEEAGGTVERVHVTELLEKKRALSDYEILAVPGGFSYGDDVGAGVVFSNQLRSHLEEDLQEFVASGKLVLGICNGFQVLVKLGLLPGIGDRRGSRRAQASLAANASGHFEDRWIHLRAESGASPFLEEGERLELPVAHAEGRFVSASTDILEGMRRNGQVALRYVRADGGPPEYPANPNGSHEDIAGITNPAGNVFGLMPHPERHVSPYQHPSWTRKDHLPEEGDGLRIFRRAVAYVRGSLNT